MKKITKPIRFNPIFLIISIIFIISIINISNFVTAPEVSDCIAIDSPGTYNLTHDIIISKKSVGSEGCINIISSDVIFNGNGYKFIFDKVKDYNAAISLINKEGNQFDNVIIENIICEGNNNPVDCMVIGPEQQSSPWINNLTIRNIINNDTQNHLLIWGLKNSLIKNIIDVSSQPLDLASSSFISSLINTTIDNFYIYSTNQDYFLNLGDNDYFGESINVTFKNLTLATISGNIKFSDFIISSLGKTATPMTLKSEWININPNLAYLYNSEDNYDYSWLKVPSTITLNNLQVGNKNILKNGAICTTCTALTSTNGESVSFTVEAWNGQTNYSTNASATVIINDSKIKTKKFDKTIKTDMSEFIKEDFNEKYGVITLEKIDPAPGSIKEKMAEYSLIKNTEICVDCEQIIKVTLYENMVLFDKVDYNLIRGEGEPLKNPDILILTTEEYFEDVPATYKEVCTTIPADENNGTVETEFCYTEIKTYKKVSHTRDVYKKYSGEVLGAGNYQYKFTGTIGIGQTIDVVQTSSNQKFSEWAPWTSADCKGVGGTVAIDGDFCVHTFLTTSEFNISSNISNATVLVVAGGGAGGSSITTSAGAGGGGAGGMLLLTGINISSNTTATVGVGGTRSAVVARGGNGVNSSFGTTIQARGGGGGGERTDSTGKANDGGSGGGAGQLGDTVSRGLGVSGQGFNGGNGNDENYNQGSGGGGSSQAGVSPTVNWVAGGPGGNGTQSSITGTPTYYAGGGGGGLHSVTAVGKVSPGGLGGGGSGGGNTTLIAPTAGTNGTGGGGGGGSYGAAIGLGMPGGNGIIIVRYLAGLYDTSIAVVNSQPSNGANITTKSITFDCNATGTGGTNITSMTLNATNWTQTITGLNQPDYNATFTNTTILNGLYSWNCIAYGTAGINGTSTSWIFNQRAYTPPNVVFNHQLPADLNLTSFIGAGGVNITYNISHPFGLQINLSTITLYFKSNSTSSNVMFFQNGTSYSGYFPKAYVDNSTNITFRWNLLDNEVLEGTYNFGEVTLENTVHARQTLSNTNSYVSVELLNVSNATRYSFYEIMSNSTNTMNFYYCNSTYAFGNSPLTNTNCLLIYTEPANAPYDHSHTAQSKHHVIPFTINETSGSVGTVKVTPTSYFLLRGAGTSAFFTISNGSRTDAFKTTSNNGNTWASQTYTVDAHLHQFSNTSSLYYYACGNDTNENQNCSAVRSDLFELAGLPPTSPIVYSPSNSYIYAGVILINYTAAESPNDYAIINYNITLLNSDYSYNQTIKVDNGVNLGYSWNSASASLNGSFYIRVEVNDSMNQKSFGDSELFNIDNIIPLIDYVTPPTPVDGANISSNNFIVQVNVTDANFANSTFRLYNLSNLLLMSSNSNQQCYQETANVSNSCGGLDTGNYYIGTTTFDTCTNNLIDGNWTSRCDAADAYNKPTFRVNYTIPANATSAEFIIKFNPIADIYANITIPTSCFNQTVRLKIDGVQAADKNFYIYCMNNSNVYTLISQINATSSGIYEEAILWSPGGKFTNLLDGTYLYNVTTTDIAGNKNSTITRRITIDMIIPQISFIAPTYPNSSNISGLSIPMNLSINETNPFRIIFSVWNSTWSNTTIYDNPVFSNYSNVIVPGDGVYYYNASITDIANLSNATENRKITLDTKLPLFSDFYVQTTGGRTGLNFTYTEIINLFRINITEINPLDITLIFKSPSGAIKVNSKMSNISYGIYNYTNDTILNEAGNWIVNITAIDTSGNINSSINTITVSTVYQDLMTEFYGYDTQTIPSNSTITNLSFYEYNIILIQDDASNINSTFSSNWSLIKNAISKANNHNMKIGLRYRLEYNLTNFTIRDSVRNSIRANFPNLKTSPYLDTVAYIEFDVTSNTDFASYNDSILTNNINLIGQEASDATGLFPIYTDYNSTNLTNNFIRYGSEFYYLTDITESGLINKLANLTRKITTRSRIYYNINDTLKTIGMNYNNKINIPQTADANISTRIGSGVGDTSYLLISELDDGNLIVYNNKSVTSNFVYNISNGTHTLGYDIYDSTNGILLMNKTHNGTITFLDIKPYSAILVETASISHFAITTAKTAASVFEVANDRILMSNHTDSVREGASDAAVPRAVELWDASYISPTTMIYYGWLNITLTPTTFNGLKYLIIADKNQDEIAKLFSATSTVQYVFGYISVGDYNVTNTTWMSSKKSEVDNWIILNNSMDIFLDGLDTASVTNGSEFLKDIINLTDYVKITKGKELGINVFTQFADFAQLSSVNGFAMRESCTSKWIYANGINSSLGYNYTKQAWEDDGFGNGDYNKSLWYNSHNINLVCVGFLDRNSTVLQPSSVNYSEMQKIYLKSKVLGYDNFVVNTPFFSLPYYDKYFDVGTELQSQTSIRGGGVYSFRYTKGTAYYNSTSDIAWFDSGRSLNDGYITLNLHDNTPFNYNICINNYCSYSVLTAGGGWSYNWYNVHFNSSGLVNDTVLFENSYGHYVVNITSLDGGYMGDDTNSLTTYGKHSFNSIGAAGWNLEADATGNHMIGLILNDTFKNNLGVTNVLNQTESVSILGQVVTAIINTAYNFFEPVWSAVTISGSGTFKSASVWNGTTYVKVTNYTTTECSSDNPIWAFNNILGIGSVGVCIEGMSLRVLFPQVITTVDAKYKLNTDNTPPVITIIYPANGGVYFNVSNINYTVYDNEISRCWYSNNSGLWNSTTQSSAVNWTNVLTSAGPNTLTVYCNDSENNVGQSSTTFTNTICHDMSTAGEYYTLPANTSLSAGNFACFNVSAANVSINCNGYSINGASDINTFGIYSNQYNTTIENCIIYNFSTGIYFNGFNKAGVSGISGACKGGVGACGGTIKNTTVLGIYPFASYPDGLGILLWNGSCNNQIINSKANVSDGHGIVILNGSSNNNIINSSGISKNDFGIMISQNSNNNLILRSNGTSSSDNGIIIDTSHYNQILDSKGMTTDSASSGSGIYIIYSDWNNISNSKGTTMTSTSEGIYVVGSLFNIIENSSSDGNMLIASYSHNNIITNATVSIGYLSIETGSKNNIVRNSKIYGNISSVWGTVYIESMNNTLYENYIDANNGSKAVMIMNTFATVMNTTMYNNTITNASTLLFLNSFTAFNTFYWNNFTTIYSLAPNAVYVNDTSSNVIGNAYNKTIDGKNQGNIYANVINKTVKIAGSVNSSILGLKIGTIGPGYPYNKTTSAGRFLCVSSKCADYAPLTYADLTPPNATVIAINNNSLGILTNTTYYNYTNQTFVLNSSDDIALQNTTLNINGLLINGTVHNTATLADLGLVLQNVVSIPIALTDGIYNWFFKVWDWTGNLFTTTPTQTTIIDTLFPIINFTDPVLSANNLTTAYDLIDIWGNVTTMDYNLKNGTLVLIGPNGYINSTQEFILNLTNSVNKSFYYNFTRLFDGQYSLQGIVYDQIGRMNRTEIRTIHITGNPPSNISFEYPTPLDGDGLYLINYIPVNVSTVEPNIKNITIRLYHSNMSLFTSASSSGYVQNFSTHFSTQFNVPNGNYYFNATSYDIYNHRNDTATIYVQKEYGADNTSFCKNLTFPGTYTLTRSLNKSNGTCLDVQQPDITINCAGYSIIVANGTPISTNKPNTIIKNCYLDNIGPAVNISGGSTTILNSTLTNSTYGVWISSGNVNIQSSTISVCSYGIYLTGTSVANFNNVIFSNNAQGIYQANTTAGSASTYNGITFSGFTGTNDLINLYNSNGNTFYNLTGLSILDDTNDGIIKYRYSSNNLMTKCTYTTAETILITLKNNSLNNRFVNCIYDNNTERVDESSQLTRTWSTTITVVDTQGTGVGGTTVHVSGGQNHTAGTNPLGLAFIDINQYYNNGTTTIFNPYEIFGVLTDYGNSLFTDRPVVTINSEGGVTLTFAQAIRSTLLTRQVGLILMAILLLVGLAASTGFFIVKMRNGDSVVDIWKYFVIMLIFNTIFLVLFVVLSKFVMNYFYPL